MQFGTSQRLTTITTQTKKRMNSVIKFILSKHDLDQWKKEAGKAYERENCLWSKQVGF